MKVRWGLGGSSASAQRPLGFRHQTPHPRVPLVHPTLAGGGEGARGVLLGFARGRFRGLHRHRHLLWPMRRQGQPCHAPRGVRRPPSLLLLSSLPAFQLAAGAPAACARPPACLHLACRYNQGAGPGTPTAHWIAKNSWGVDGFGERGYVKIPMMKDGTNGYCNMYEYAALEPLNVAALPKLKPTPPPKTDPPIPTGCVDLEPATSCAAMKVGGFCEAGALVRHGRQQRAGGHAEGRVSSAVGVRESSRHQRRPPPLISLPSPTQTLSTRLHDRGSRLPGCVRKDVRDVR